MTLEKYGIWDNKYITKKQKIKITLVMINEENEL